MTNFPCAWTTPIFTQKLLHPRKALSPTQARVAVYPALWTCYALCPPSPHPNPHAEALNPNVTVLGDRTFKEVMQVKWDHKGGAQSDRLVSLTEEEGTRDFPPSLAPLLPLPLFCGYRGKAIWVCREKGAVCKPRREPSLDNNHDSTSILDFQSPKRLENKLWLFKPPKSVVFRYGSLS